MTALLYGSLLLMGLGLLAYTALRMLLGGVGSGRLEERYAAGELSTEEYRRLAGRREGPG